MPRLFGKNNKVPDNETRDLRLGSGGLCGPVLHHRPVSVIFNAKSEPEEKLWWGGGNGVVL
jgi:hypothetical protein